MKGLIVDSKKIALKDNLSAPRAKKSQELLVKVICGSVNQLDAENIEGKYDFLLKLSGGNHQVKTGIEFSGVVLEGNEKFKQGDKVLGYVHLLKGLKTHQEVISINEEYITHMPKALSFEQAAALPLGALTSLIALRELGQVEPGKRILINGASGGLGVYAVQLAKIMGANITAVAGKNQEPFLRALGADTVIDYHEQTIESLRGTFDVLLDLSNQKRFREIKHLLNARGIFIPAEPNKHVVDILLSPFKAKKTKYLMVDRGNHQELTQIAKWVDDGKLKAFVDSVYSLDDYRKAFERLSVKGKQGRIILRVSQEV